MLKRARKHLSYANVMSTIAAVVAIGGASAYAATHLPAKSVGSKAIKAGAVKTKKIHKSAVTTGKLRDNAVTSLKVAPNAIGTTQIADQAVTTTKIADNAVTTGKIADQAVTTGKIADNAVTNGKLAANSVSGLVQVVDGTITGSDVLENTLNFGCTPTPNVIGAVGATGPIQVGGTGFCGFVVTSGSHTWAQAAATCSGIVPDSTLPTAAQLEELATSAGTQSPPTGTTGIWLDAPSGANSAWTAAVGNDAHVSGFVSTALTNSSAGPVVYVAEPARKQG